MVGFDAWRTDRRPFGIRVDEETYGRSPAYFSYLAHVEKVRSLDLGRADVVISTQPPSFFAEHPRHLSVFFHHQRSFYDLSPYLVRAGTVDSPVHEVATRAIRRLDDDALDRVTHVLAGSETVADRLAEFNGRRDRVSVFHAGPTVDAADSAVNADGAHVLCVSRHDFPKRTELFLHAARLAPELTCISVGAGGRLGWLRELDDRFTASGVPAEIDDTELWLNDPPWIAPSTAPASANLRFASDVDRVELDALYRTSLCVVAPALLEDYGLTVIESMRYGKPVIVCTDGGHLCHFVHDGVNGLVVEPTGAAIADAMRRIATDADLRRRLGAAAQETAAEFTWRRGLAEFDAAFDLVTS